MVNNIFIYVSIIVLICALITIVGFIAHYYYYKSKLLRINIDNKKLYHVTHLIPWIHKQIEKSTEVIVSKYMNDVQDKKIERELDPNIFVNMIKEVRDHFYGTIPKSLCHNLFEYIDSRQIDILVLTSFKRFNNNYFVIGGE